MSNNTTLIDNIRTEIHLTLDELVRRGAQRMLEAALQAEVDAYIQSRTQERDENDHALVVRNGRSQERTVYCGAGQLKLRTPRIHDKREGQTFTSRCGGDLTHPLEVMSLKSVWGNGFTHIGNEKQSHFCWTDW